MLTGGFLPFPRTGCVPYAKAILSCGSEIRQTLSARRDGTTRLIGTAAILYCYAKFFSERFRGMPGHPLEKGFDLRLVRETLEQKLQWRRRRMIGE